MPKIKSILATRNFLVDNLGEDYHRLIRAMKDLDVHPTFLIDEDHPQRLQELLRLCSDRLSNVLQQWPHNQPDPILLVPEPVRGGLPAEAMLEWGCLITNYLGVR